VLFPGVLRVIVQSVIVQYLLRWKASIGGSERAPKVMDRGRNGGEMAMANETSGPIDKKMEEEEEEDVLLWRSL
jgi:hypothetical protein